MIAAALEGTDGDKRAAARVLGISRRTLEDVTDYLRASPGALVADTQSGSLFRIGTITPRQQPDGRCVFLTDEGRCAIHAVAPFGCAMFDTHMSASEGAARSTWGLRVIQASDAYRALRATLTGTR